MNPEFKYIVIIFENCNSIEIPSEKVDRLGLDEITYSLTTNFCQQYWKNFYCKEMSLYLNKDVLNIKTHWQSVDDDLATENLKKHLFEYHDITGIEITDCNENKEYIFVPWCPKDEYSNSWEKVEFDGDQIKIEIKEPDEHEK